MSLCRLCPRRAVAGLVYCPAHAIDLSRDDLWTLLLCSLRYAMGRATYMPGLVQEIYARHRAALTPEQRAQVVREVREELDAAERSGRALGMAMDHAGWRRFVEEQERQAQGGGV